jgi:hypothetical protein
MILRDSRRVLTDLGPSRARMAGYAGSLVTYTASPHDHNANRTADPNGARTRRNGLRGEHMLRPRQTRYTDTPRCGAPVNVQGERCWRLPGHRQGHRSKAAMDNENVRRGDRERVRA